MKTQSLLHALLLSLVAALTAVSPARASIDSLWSSATTVGAKGALYDYSSDKIQYIYVLDSAGAVCRLYNADNFTQAYSFSMSCGTYTYLWNIFLNDINGNSAPEVLVYEYNIGSYKYSARMVDAAAGAVIKNWQSGSYSYFPKFVGTTPGSNVLKLGIEKSSGTAGSFPSSLLVYSLGITGVEGKTPGGAPRGVRLEQSVPNPFNDQTRIDFNLPKADRVKLTVYNQLGQVVETLVDGPLSPGDHSVRWNPNGAAAGAYFYQLQIGGEAQTKKLLYIK